MAENRTILGSGAVSVPTGTTAERPASPTVGTLRYNTGSKSLEVYNGTGWAFIDISPGTISDYPVTSVSQFELSAPAAGTYWIQPAGASSAFQCEYSGANYRGSGYGFFRWYRTVDQSAPTVNFYGQNLQWLLMMIEKEGSTWHTIGFGSNRTFNSRQDNETGTTGTRAGYRVFFGGGGWHGIYNTGQSPCNWGNSSGAIGAGWDGSTCGTFPNNLIMGEGTTSANYTNRGGTWSFWFRW